MTLTEARNAIAQRLHDANHTGTLASQGLYLRDDAKCESIYWWIGLQLTAERIMRLTKKGYALIDWPNPSADIDQEALRLALRLKNEGVSFDPD